jgi:phosphoribosyl-AMP cyclohydrolase
MASQDQNIENSKQLSIAFEKRGGLVPAIVQDAKTGQVLMLGYANNEALEISIKTRKATFFSTSRNEIWTKGLTSGDELRILSIFTDCDQDAIIYQVEIMGKGACHTKNKNQETRQSCFYRVYDFDKQELENLDL